MKTLIVYMWSENNKPFGVFTSQDEADKCIAMIANNICVTFESLKLDLYVYYLAPNKFYNPL